MNSLTGQQERFYKEFSDLRKTQDKQIALTKAPSSFDIDYLINIYNNQYTKLAAYTPWTVKSMDYSEQKITWFNEATSTPTIHKVAGFKFFTEFQGSSSLSNAQYHGFRMTN